MGDRECSAYPGWITGIANGVAGSAHHEVTTHTPLYSESRGHRAVRWGRASCCSGTYLARGQSHQWSASWPAWHKGRASSRHEHRAVERGDATARAMLGVALRCADIVTARCTLTRRLSQAGRSLPVPLPVQSFLQRDIGPAGLQRHRSPD